MYRSTPETNHFLYAVCQCCLPSHRARTIGVHIPLSLKESPNTTILENDGVLARPSGIADAWARADKTKGNVKVSVNMVCLLCLVRKKDLTRAPKVF